MTHLNVSEVFGTVQGEGPHTGAPATFLRLAGCNLACGWCDTPYSWDWDRYDRASEVERIDVSDAARLLAEQPARLLVVTGGEPLLQRAGLSALCAQLPGEDWRVQLETNGTISPGWLADDRRVEFVVSPKLGNSGEPIARRYKPDVLAEFAGYARTGRAWLKIVCADEDDVWTARDLAEKLHWPLPRVSVMAEGATRDEHLATLTAIADAAVVAGLHLQARLHLLAWPTLTRGR